jgi:hypothetical protein
MAFYLITKPINVTSWELETLDEAVIVEADSAKEAVAALDADEGTVNVWTLRGEPRTYQIETETVTTIKQT